MKPTAEQIEAAREFIKAMVGRGYFKLTAAFVDEHGEAGSSTMLASLIAEREAAARDAAERERDELRQVLMPFALFASALKNIKPHWPVLQYDHQSLSAGASARCRWKIRRRK